MVVPWTGFPMRALIDLARPLAAAHYVEMHTFSDPEAAPGQRQAWYPWPYVEGLTIEEATNELAFLVTGIYGKPLPKQNGAPLRLATPWKYGFKSIKSIVRFHLPTHVLGPHSACRVRLLGQCQSGCAASALEPGDRARPGDRRPHSDEALQRVRGVRPASVPRHCWGAALHMRGQLRRQMVAAAPPRRAMKPFRRCRHDHYCCGEMRRRAGCCFLIPGLDVKLSTTFLAEPTVLSAVGASPPHDGVRRRWWINV